MKDPPAVQALPELPRPKAFHHGGKVAFAEQMTDEGPPAGELA